jgi:hypothetical protein
MLTSKKIENKEKEKIHTVLHTAKFFEECETDLKKKKAWAE